MMDMLVYGMVYAGAALMAYNIYRYIKFARGLRARGGWDQEGKILYVPTIMLIMFLAGYLAVGIFGQPDLIIGGILFGGSLFVLSMILFLGRVVVRVQENERLGAKLRSAEESNRAKTNFLSVMSHEMRTPLNAILGLNGMALKDPELTDGTRDKLQKLDASAHHLLTLINDTLDMNRIDSGRMELSIERFAIKDLIEQTNIIIGGQCAEKGLEYVCNVDDGVYGYYRGDETKLRQVLVNILGNAVKFTPVPGTITFTVKPVTSYQDLRTLRFVIADTGIGMDKEFLPNLFSAFTQESSGNTNRYGGSGLGMAITKNIVDMMNGDIQVESEKGKGSTFTVTVSLHACEDDPCDVDAGVDTAGDGADAADSSAVSLEGLHILLAEDVEINAEILMDLLDMEGVSADRAENGQVAVDMFANSEEGCYQAVLMDVRMPVMDGLSAAKAIRALDRPDARTIPIIALTANAFEEDVQRSLQAGMDAHLSKPVEIEDLCQTLRVLVGGGGVVIAPREG